MVDRLYPRGLVRPKKLEEGHARSRKRPFTMVLAVAIILLLVFSTVLLLIIDLPKSSKASVNAIDIDIDGEACNVSVTLDVPSSGRMGRTVKVEHGNGTEELVFDGKNATGSVPEEAFRSIMADGTVRVKGTVSFKLIGLFKLERSVATDFDISSIASSLKDLEVSNVSVTPTLKGYMVIEISLRSGMDERLDLSIRDAPAELVLTTGTFGATVNDLWLEGSSGSGTCTLSVPTAAVLTIMFLNRTVSFDCYGIAGSFVLPQ